MGPCHSSAALADSDQEPQLRAALTELERLGARPLAAAVARKLRELGVRGLARGPRPATSADPANLTARETEVLALVTERTGLGPAHHATGGKPADLTCLAGDRSSWWP
jgi:hypothetical protein